MTAAVYLLVYGAAVTFLAPPLLSRLTRAGVNPRLGVIVWLAAIAGVLIAWAVAVAVIVVRGMGALPDSAIVVCLELLGVPERVATPDRLSLVLLIATALAVSIVVCVRVGRTIVVLRSRSRDHAFAARLIGVPTHRPDVFVLAADEPAAYCVVGRPHAIVVTSAAMDRLDRPQLDAVLAHEDAHISGRHHHVLMFLRALAGALAWLPLFTRGAAAVGDLLEMCADDTAVRRHGRSELVAGMITLAGPVVPVVGLAVASTAVAVRAHRLLAPVRGGRLWAHQVLVCTATALMVAVPVVVNAICHH